MMRRTWIRLVPALIAVAVMLGAVGTASAVAQPTVDAGIAAYTPSDNGAHEDTDDEDEDEDGEDGERGRGRGPLHSTSAFLDDVNALCVDPDPEAQSLTVLCNLYDIVEGFMPEVGMHGLARAILAHADRVTPEWRGRGDGDPSLRGRADTTAICRRVVRLLHASDATVTADAGGLVERCRGVLSDGDPLTASEICRRLQASGTAGEHPSLTQRCRTQFGDGDGDGPGNPLASCRRLLASGEVDDHPELAERCRNLIDGDGDDARVRPGRPSPAPQATS